MHKMQIGMIDSNQKIVTNGLTLNLDAGQLRSYPTTGTIWTDLSGNGLNASLANGPTFDTANGGSIVFDGTDDYASINPSTLLSNVSQFSYSCFANFTTSVGNRGTFFSHGPNLVEFTNDIIFFWDKTTNQLIFQINNGIDGGANLSYSPTSNWFNLSVVYNGSLSTNADKLKVYINTVQQTLNFNIYK
jgi:hypothetical protein